MAKAGGIKLAMRTEISNKPYKILNRDAIKYIAMFTMLLNHIATIFMTPGTWLFEFFLAIGYFTAITMVYFLVEGYHYTHSKKTYISRLFFFALLSEIPYCLAFSTNGMIEFCGLNMLFSLCVCFGILYVLDTVTNKLAKACLVILGIIISLFCDWALLAPIFTLLFAWARNSEHRTKIAFCLSVVIFGAFNFVGGIGRFPLGANMLYALLSIIGMGMAAICILFFYNGKRTEKGKAFSKWFFYLFYPVHLLILGILRLAFIG